MHGSSTRQVTAKSAVGCPGSGHLRPTPPQNSTSNGHLQLQHLDDDATMPWYKPISPDLYICVHSDIGYVQCNNYNSHYNSIQATVPTHSRNAPLSAPSVSFRFARSPVHDTTKAIVSTWTKMASPGSLSGVDWDLDAQIVHIASRSSGNLVSRTAHILNICVSKQRNSWELTGNALGTERSLSVSVCVDCYNRVPSPPQSQPPSNAPQKGTETVRVDGDGAGQWHAKLEQSPWRGVGQFQSRHTPKRSEGSPWSDALRRADESINWMPTDCNTSVTFPQPHNYAMTFAAAGWDLLGNMCSSICFRTYSLGLISNRL